MFIIFYIESGDIYSWGYNLFGQLGHGDNKNRNKPEQLIFFKNKENIQVCCGCYFSIVLSSKFYIYLLY